MNIHIVRSEQMYHRHQVFKRSREVKMRQHRTCKGDTIEKSGGNSSMDDLLSFRLCWKAVGNFMHSVFTIFNFLGPINSLVANDKSECVIQVV